MMMSIPQGLLSQGTPQQIDTRLAELYDEQQKAQWRRDMLLESLHRPVGDLRDRAGWQLTAHEALVRARSMIKLADEQNTSRPREIERTLAELMKNDAELTRIDSAQAPLETEYGERRWNRYFLVTNGNGHVHREMTCRTCFRDTQFAWLPELSGCDEAEMITEFGEKACTVCFPDAPSNPAYHGPGRRDREALAAKAAEKAERQAKKAAKNLRPDEQFTNHSAWRVTTVAGCKEALRDEVWLRDAFGRGVHPDHARSLAAAARAAEVLLAREERAPGTGATQAEIDRIIGNAVKKNRREGARI